MAVKRRVSGAWVDITAPKRRSGGTMIAITSIKVRSGGTWVEKLSTPLTLSKSGDAYGGGETPPIFSNAVTITASGGTGGTKTYTWTFDSNPGGVSIVSPSASSTQFSKASGLAVGVAYTAVARCTVSDGTNSTSITVNVTIERYESGGA